jgi:uncharacterized membrane protein
MLDALLNEIRSLRRAVYGPDYAEVTAVTLADAAALVETLEALRADIAVARADIAAIRQEIAGQPE